MPHDLGELQEAVLARLQRGGGLLLGELGAHYRLGWDEKARNEGKPLVDGIVDLPDRRPGSER